jgi:hypothetical protein
MLVFKQLFTYFKHAVLFYKGSYAGSIRSTPCWFFIAGDLNTKCQAKNLGSLSFLLKAPPTQTVNILLALTHDSFPWLPNRFGIFSICLKGPQVAWASKESLIQQ